MVNLVAFWWFVCLLIMNRFITVTHIAEFCKIILTQALFWSQVEFETLKVDVSQKDEEQELLRAQLEEAGRLREIAERQLEEALEALKDEREQKKSLKRELASHTVNPFDSVVPLQLDESIDGDRAGDEKEHGNKDEQDSGYIYSKGSETQRCSTPRTKDSFLRPPAPGLVADLLSELHLSDTQRLKQQLMQVGF